MKKPFKERFADFSIMIVRPIILLVMSRELKVIAKGDKIDKNREPFILVSNHFNTWDAFVVMKNVKSKIRFLATAIAFLDQAKGFGMRVLARAIPKRVGKSDYTATKKVFEYLKLGYSIGFFPEGDNTFYGETLPIFKSSGKLIKKADVDVVLVKQQGGYISQPRWADNFAKNGIVETETLTLLTKEEIRELTPTQINKIIEKSIYNNDYDYQREKMYKFKRKARAEGIERLIYYCNNCKGVLTVFGNNDDIICSKCGKIGHINEYEFIEGNKYDNLVDYNKYQYKKIEEVINSEFVFMVTLNLVNHTSMKNIRIGKYKLRYKDKKILLSDNISTYTFELEKMKYPCNTMRNSFSFDYEEETYNFTDIRHQFVLYEMIRHLNGSYKN